MNNSNDGTTGQFQVDLRGLVELLSRHLYSSPRVYVRELLQNGVDAIVQAADADTPTGTRKRWRLGREHPAQQTAIEIWPADVSPDGRFHCFDRGVGLDATDLRDFLSTIGRSSKRDELGFARSDLLGQFGIGLLSCFMVSDDIAVVSRKGDGALTGWTGRSDGTYDLHPSVTLERSDPRRAWLSAGSGTCVSLTPATDAGDWLTAARVGDLAAGFGEYLPHRIVVRTGDGERVVAPQEPPWQIADPTERQRACHTFAQTRWGVDPLAVLPMSVPAAGLTGFAAVLPGPSHPGQEPAHTAYLKGMLLSHAARGLTPDWAFFVRVAVDVENLRPTAAREGLYDDELLEAVRTSIGDQLKRWLKHLGQTNPTRFATFLTQHDLALKSMSLHDDELLSIVLPILPFETNQGTATLTDLFQTTDEVFYCTEIDQFRQLAAVAGAQGLAVVNACYTHETDLLARSGVALPGRRVSRLDPTTFEAHIREVSAERMTAVKPQLEAVRHTLAGLDVVTELREFRPSSLPALLLHEDAHRRRAESREVAAKVDDVWAGVLTSFDDGGDDRPRLLLNDNNRVVRRLLGQSDPDRTRMVIEALYARALLTAGRPLRPADVAMIDSAFTSMIDLAFPELP